MHAGGIWGWNNWGPKKVSHYSLGMRQRLFQEFGNASTSLEPRIYLTSSRVNDSEWTHSKYCLAPAGDGFGIRMVKSAALNCVPLIAQPYVVQGFEDLLPYERFSKRLEFDQVPQLPAMLRSRGLSQMARGACCTAPLRGQCAAPQPMAAPQARAPPHPPPRPCPVPTRTDTTRVASSRGLRIVLTLPRPSRRASVAARSPSVSHQHTGTTQVRMRRDLEAVRPAFIWDETLGLAYNYTLLSLCHRAVELHGRLRAGPNASCAALAAALPLAKPRRRVPLWYPPAVRKASQALMRERRCASEFAEPTDANGAAAKVCAEEALAAAAQRVHRVAAARNVSRVR